jgi:hypothetical protein
MRKILLVSVVLLASIMLFASTAQAALIDDAYHFNAAYASSPNAAAYTEWWYFDFNQANLNGVIQYSLWDPGDAGATPNSFGLMYVSLQQKSGVLNFEFPLPWSAITTSTTDANLNMGPESIAVSAAGVYTISGTVEDQSGNVASWNLQYTQQLSSLNGVRNLQTPIPGETMNWYVQMPSAAVTGTLTLNGQTFQICARGYHDHNWGEFLLPTFLWNWFQTSTSNMAIVGYDFYSLNTGQITVQIGSQTITFAKNQYLYLDRDNTTTSLTGVPLTFPQQSTILAFNGKYSLVLNIQVNPAETGFTGGAFSSTVAWFVLESTATFTGLLLGPNTFMPINSVGFREYTLDAKL